MNVSLTPELENFVNATISSGRYTSASEVVNEALRLLEEREHTRTMQADALGAALDERLASLDHGEGLDGEEVFSRIREKSAQRRRQQG